MEVVRDRAALATARAQLAAPVGLVPTMGALHAGHRVLLERARDRSAAVVASIFVNPRQFAASEDLARYPRDEAADLAMCGEAGVDLVFAPTVDAIYPPGASTVVDVGPLGERLEGAHRPGHFRGVATVVAILLSLVHPDRAFFGQKDGQQVLVIERLVRDLGLPVEIEVVPTVREPDGLAMSSRNRFLSAEERAAAPVLYRALRAAEAAWAGGEHDAERLRGVMSGVLAAEPLAQPDYVSVADEETVEELATVDGAALLSLAVRFPSARLIDCLPLA
jgi:pantoate--beta-alanine ligase